MVSEFHSIARWRNGVAEGYLIDLLDLVANDFEYLCPGAKTEELTPYSAFEQGFDGILGRFEPNADYQHSFSVLKTHLVILTNAVQTDSDNTIIILIFLCLVTAIIAALILFLESPSDVFNILNSNKKQNWFQSISYAIWFTIYMYFQNKKFTLWRPSHFWDHEFLTHNFLERDFPYVGNRPSNKQKIELSILPTDEDLKEWSYTYPKVKSTGGKMLTMFVVITGYAIGRLAIAAMAFRDIPLNSLVGINVAADLENFNHLYFYRANLIPLSVFSSVEDALDDSQITAVVLERFRADTERDGRILEQRLLSDLSFVIPVADQASLSTINRHIIQVQEKKTKKIALLAEEYEFYPSPDQFGSVTLNTNTLWWLVIVVGAVLSIILHALKLLVLFFHRRAKRLQLSKSSEDKGKISNSFTQMISTNIIKASKEDSRLSVARKIRRFNNEIKQNRHLLVRIEERILKFHTRFKVNILKKFRKYFISKENLSQNLTMTMSIYSQYLTMIDESPTIHKNITIGSLSRNPLNLRRNLSKARLRAVYTDLITWSALNSDVSEESQDISDDESLIHIKSINDHTDLEDISLNLR